MHSLKWRLVSDAWALQTTDGLIAGTGVELRFRIKARPGVFALYRAVCASLDECSMTLDELANATSFAPGIVRDVIPQFARLGLVAEDTPNGAANDDEKHELQNHPLFAYFSTRSKKPYLHTKRVAATRIGIFAGRGIEAPLAYALGQQGFGKIIDLPQSGENLVSAESTVELFEGSDFIIAAAADAVERLQIFPLLNSAALKTKKSWLAGHIDRDTAVVGPLFVPGETACFNCLELREENHLPNLADYNQFRALVRETPVTLRSSAAPFSIAFLVQALISESVRWTSRLALPATYQTLVETSLSTLESAKHNLLKVPLCNVCGPHVERPFRRTWNI